MLFLLEYDRSAGRLVTYREFEDRERVQADDARLELELALHRNKCDHEVVVLEAQSKEVLLRTHKRYFADLDELIADLANTISSFVIRERKD